MEIQTIDYSFFVCAGLLLFILWGIFKAIAQSRKMKQYHLYERYCGHYEVKDINSVFQGPKAK